MSDKDHRDARDKSPELGLPLHHEHTPTTPVDTRRNTAPKAKIDVRAEANAFLGEFIGTFMFLSLAFAGTQIALNAVGSQDLTSSTDKLPDVGKLLYIAFAFGVSLAINVAIFADISGGKFNPAVTAALFATGAIPWFRAAHTFISQIIAGMAAAGFISGLLPGPLTIGTTLDPSISVTRGLFLEAFVTSQLILTILMLGFEENQEHRKTKEPLFTASKPFYIGLSLFIAEICSVYYTGGSLNPARSFGPAVVTGFPGYHWIYWLGPLLGAGVASGAFKLIHWIRAGEEARIRRASVRH